LQTGEMLPLLKRHEIQVLLRAGHAQRDVAVRTGCTGYTSRPPEDRPVFAREQGVFVQPVRAMW